MASLPVKIATAVDADKLAVGEIVVNSTNGEVWTKTSAGEVKKVGAGSDAYLLNRVNHTGTQTMSSISDKQGKVLDDLIEIEDVSVIETTFAVGGYIIKEHEDNGVFAGATVLVSENGGVVSQLISAPVVGKIWLRRYKAGVWSDASFTLAPFDVQVWYSNTTAEAANAVINADGTFSRSIATFNPSPLLVVSGASHAFVKADVNQYARYTASDAKAATFDSSEGFTADDEFHIANRAASGNITISGTGVTFNAPKGGTLVLEPNDTVTVKFVSPTEADVMGSVVAA